MVKKVRRKGFENMEYGEVAPERLLDAPQAQSFDVFVFDERIFIECIDEFNALSRSRTGWGGISTFVWINLAFWTMIIFATSDEASLGVVDSEDG